MNLHYKGFRSKSSSAARLFPGHIGWLRMKGFDSSTLLQLRHSLWREKDRIIG